MSSTRQRNTSVLMSQSRGLGWHEHDGCTQPRSAGSCGSAGRPENRLSDIARALDRAPGTIHNTLRARGGVWRPERRRARRALLAAEREEISRGIAVGESVRSIARRLERAPSTISREIARNGGRGRYRATPADGRAWARCPASLSPASSGEAACCVSWSPPSLP